MPTLGAAPTSVRMGIPSVTGANLRARSPT